MALAVRDADFKNPYILNVYRDLTRDMCIAKRWHNASVEQVWMYFIEEVGELAGSIRRGTNQFCDRKKTKIEDEMGDVFSYMFQLAYMFDIDLDRMWQKNQTKAYKKHYLPGSHCGEKNPGVGFHT